MVLIFADPKVREQRLKACGMCEHLDKSRCKICGCYVRLKSKLKHAECPLDRWREKILQEEMTGRMTSTFEIRTCCGH